MTSYEGDAATAEIGISCGSQRAWLLDFQVDSSGLVDLLFFSLPLPRSWAELKHRLKQIAPNISFVASRITDKGTCVPVDKVAARIARPLGSAFKLYVLGALARAVRNGQATWDEQLAIRDDWKSAGSGDLQDVAAGTPLPLSLYAEKMISISDNTAADHLIHFLGRRRVERQQRRFDMANPKANEPFLTTRELFALKYNEFPKLANHYDQLNRHERREYLEDVIDPLPFPPADPGDLNIPRSINTIEYFGSPNDMCHAFVGLDKQAANPALAEVSRSLSLNDGGLGLDPQHWSRVWFKGGSEAGVLTLNYMAQTTDGCLFVVSVMTSDPAKSLDDPFATGESVARAQGAFALLSPGSTDTHVSPHMSSRSRAPGSGPARLSTIPSQAAPDLRLQGR